MKYALSFGFTRGVYVGFQQCFLESSTKQPFEDMVVNPLLTNPQICQFDTYKQMRDTFNKCNQNLKQHLDEKTKEHLISVCSAWEDQFEGILRYAFYFGYRYAMSVIDNVNPIGSYMDKIGNILLIEYEVGFIRTFDEQQFQRKDKKK